MVKGKSMVSEEIGLNEALMGAGIEVSETDLGEYIIQLAGETPSHIIAPAIHKTRDDVGSLFADKLDIPYETDPPRLTWIARKALREKFLAADLGTSGCNIACAETGHITTVSNEGNIRMSTTLPRVHIAIMGMERVAARLEDHDMLLRLLCRGAAAQNMATYVSYIGGPRSKSQADGPQEFHLVVLDNGRSRILADPEFREMLCCIRCGACLNHCPVYGAVGGHAYGWVYPGPMGSVLTPLMIGLKTAGDLPNASSLCGRCEEVCPMSIPLPELLRRQRVRQHQAGLGHKRARWALALWGAVARRPRLYQALTRPAVWLLAKLAGRAGRLRRLPLVGGWTSVRDLPAPEGHTFQQQWQARQRRQMP